MRTYGKLREKIRNVFGTIGGDRAVIYTTGDGAGVRSTNAAGTGPGAMDFVSKFV